MNNTEKARDLRKNQTDAERVMWQQLRNRRLLNLKFRRQLPIGDYIVDFVSMSLKFIVELDGGQHMDNILYDNQRTRFLNSLGFEVVRFWNHDVLKSKTSVLESLTLTLSQRERGQKI